MRHFRWLVVCAVLSGILAAVSGASAPAQTAPSDPGFAVRIGVALPLTGGVASFGEAAKNGILTAVDEARAAGWEIDLIYGDSQCNGTIAAQVARQLIYTDSVKYILGEVCSSASIPISEIAEQAKVVQISPTSSNPNVTIWGDGRDKEYVYRVINLDSFQGEEMAVWAADAGAMTAAVLYNEFDWYTAELAGGFKQRFEATGGAVSVFLSYGNDTANDDAYLAQVKAANPDVLFLADYAPRVNGLATAAHTQGVTATLLGGDGWDTPALDNNLFDESYFATQFWPDEPRQAVADFVDAYDDAYGARPDAIAALSYDAANALFRAISRAGRDDATAVKRALDELIYEGVTGAMTFDAQGDIVKGQAIIEVTGGGKLFSSRLAPVSQVQAVNDGPVAAGASVTLSATVATGDPASYMWDAGDGAVLAGASVAHTYAAAGLYHAVVTATNTFNQAVGETIVAVSEQVTATPGEVVTTTDHVLALDAPAALGATLTITYTPQVDGTPSDGALQFAGTTWHLDVTDAGGNPVTQPALPLTLTVHYDPATLPEYVVEASLQVQRYDEAQGAWVTLSKLAQDLDANTLTVLLDHFSEFAVMGPYPDRIWMALVRQP